MPKAKRSPTEQEISFFRNLLADPRQCATKAARSAGYGNPSVAGHRLLRDERFQWLRDLLFVQPKYEDMLEHRKTLARMLHLQEQKVLARITIDPTEIYQDDGLTLRDDLEFWDKACLEPVHKCGEANDIPQFSKKWKLISGPGEIRAYRQLADLYFAAAVPQQSKESLLDDLYRLLEPNAANPTVTDAPEPNAANPTVTDVPE